MAGIDVLARAGKQRADPAFWLLIGQLIMFTGVAAVFPIAPLYVAHRGGNSIAVAIFIAGPLVANTLVQVPAGRLCDRWGRKPFLIGPRLVYAFLSLFLFFNIGTLAVLTAIRILMGACAGAYVPALRAALTDLSAPEQRAQRFSQLQAYEMVGLLIGPLIGGAAALWRDSAVFGITGLSMFIGLGSMLRVPETRAERSSTVVRKERFRWWRIRGIVVPIAALFAVGTIWSMYDVVWPQYLSARGYGTLIIGVSVSLFALPILVLARAGGRLADRADRRKLVTAGLVSPTWDDGPTKGIVTDSIVSFIVRAGNPKHIKTWADLVKPGVQVITPNQEQHPARVFRQKDRRLPRRIASSHDNSRTAAAEQRLSRCRGVVNSRPFKSFEALNIQPPILGTRRDEKALGSEGLASVRIENRVPVFE